MFSGQHTELVGLVATVRYAYIIAGFPASVQFVDSILTIIAIIVVGVVVWVLYYYPKDNHIHNKVVVVDNYDKQKVY